MPAAVRYAEVDTEDNHQQPPRRRGQVLKVLFVLGVALAAYACYTLVAEGNAVSHTAATAPSGYSSPYLSSAAPTPEELDFRAKLASAFNESPEEGFAALVKDGADGLTQAEFQHILSAIVHASISGAVDFQNPAILGPFAAFAATVTSRSQSIQVSAPVVVDRVFATLDTSEPKGIVTKPEFMAFFSLLNENPLAGAMLVLDVDGDGLVSADEVDGLIVDTLHAIISVLHQATDVLEAGVNSVVDIAATLMSATFAPSCTVDRMWQLLLSAPGFVSEAAPALVATVTDQVYAQQRAAAFARLDVTRAAFVAAVGAAPGADTATFAAVTARDVLSSETELASVIAALRDVPGMPPLPPALVGAATLESANTTLRGAPSLPPALAALVASAKAAAVAEHEHIMYALLVLLDGDGDGLLSVAEFDRMQAVERALTSDDAALQEATDRVRAVVQALFDVADADGNGELSTPEIRRCMSAAVQLVRQYIHSGLEVVDVLVPDAVPLLTAAVVAGVDADGDGKISAADALASFMAMQSPAA